MVPHVASEATFSLGMWRSIENKEHSVHLDLVLAIENTGFSKALFYRNQIEQKWSRRVSESAGNRQLIAEHLGRLGQMRGSDPPCRLPGTNPACQ